MNKGKWIYTSIVLINLLLVMLPTSTTLFKMSYNNFDQIKSIDLLPDILGLISIPLGYVVVKQFYRKHASYVKNYAYLALAVAMIWTVAAQIK